MIINVNATIVSHVDDLVPLIARALRANAIARTWDYVIPPAVPAGE